MVIFPNERQDPVQVAQHYDSLDILYRELWGEHLHHGLWLSGSESRERAVIQLVEHLAEHAGIQAGDRVCDVGCGYGATSLLLEERWNARVTGVTISERQYTIATSRIPNGSKVNYLLCDWLENPFLSDSFDHVISIESTEHMSDKAEFFRQAYRVLRPGGRLAVYAWVATDRPKPWEVRYLLEPICREGRLPGLGLKDSYYRWMRGAGFKDVCSEDLTDQVKQTWKVCILRLFQAIFTSSKLRRYLFSGDSTERSFVKTIFRIPIAYETKSMQYRLFIAKK